MVGCCVQVGKTIPADKIPDLDKKVKDSRHALCAININQRLASEQESMTYIRGPGCRHRRRGSQERSCAEF